MKVVKASAEIVQYTPNLTQTLERAGRTAWKSEDKITPDSASAFIARIKTAKHESVLEHGVITVLFVVDRGISHELVRHRLASFTQESTRYCNYTKGKFNGELTFIQPCFWEEDDTQLATWRLAMQRAEESYERLIKTGATPQEARSVLPNSLKTEIVVTANPREWRHIFKLRCDKTAHPQMREVMLPLFKMFCDNWPDIFNDVSFEG